MDAPGWRSNRTLSKQLHKSYWQFNYYQLIRLLIMANAKKNESEADLDNCRNSYECKSAEDINSTLRIRGELSWAFPGNEVSKVDTGKKENYIELHTPNYCVAGYQGPLPEPYVDICQRQQATGNSAMADFFDIFNHRINALRYEIKSRHHVGLSADHPEDSPYAQYLAAIMGMAENGMLERLPVTKRSLLGMAGLLAGHRKGVIRIKKCLEFYLTAPIEVKQLKGSWAHIAEDQHTKIGVLNSHLGKSTALGRRVWDQQAAVLIKVGPLPYAKLKSLLPSGNAYKNFKELLHFLTDRQYDCHIRLLTEDNNVPCSYISSSHSDSQRESLKLGQTTWLKSNRSRPDGPVKQTGFVIPAYSGHEHHNHNQFSGVQS